MLKFTANYANTNDNFVIQNISDKSDKKNEYYPIICVVKNILQRGCPTLLSEYLTKHIDTNLLEEDQIYLISNKVPKWGNLIKGDERNNNFPAKNFFYKIIPEYLKEFKFIQQLIIPETSFNEIKANGKNSFYQSRVDFFLPQAQLVIEIDGRQHQENLNKINDRERDRYLDENGIKTIRIETKHIRSKSIEFKKKIKEIKAHLNMYSKVLNNYKNSYLSISNKGKNTNIKESLLATAIIRFQILILILLETGKLNIADDVWDIMILERDINAFADIAINDLLLWLKNLCKLAKLEFVEPKLNLKSVSSIEELYSEKNAVKIDFSLKRRWTNQNDKFPEVIFLRTDYYDNKNYFKVSTAKPIKYKIIADDKDNDYSALIFILKNIFGFDDFNSGQLPIIINSLARIDTIGLLPTGSGKSLCYQLVSLLQPCISFVVAPIKALMYDQKDNLDKQYITNTNYITGDQSPDEKRKIQREFSEGKYLFIWISPERFQSADFRNYLDKLNKTYNFGLAVIDEAHCISEWGHDFRTSYLVLARTIRKYCPSTIFLGLTATASVNVLKDILIELEIDKSNVKTLPSFTRPELEFRVIKEQGRAKKKKLYKIMDKLIESKDVLSTEGENTKSGIIFTSFVTGDNGCYKISKQLKRKYNIDIRYYSGSKPYFLEGMNQDDFKEYKNEVQKDFKNNKFSLLVATKAFGMGIDKRNIRYTIHYGIPNSMEALYQEAGRAGRDKEKAACYILYSPETKGAKYIDEVFDLNSTVKDIKKINKKINKEDSGDIFRNIFLWLINKKSLEEDFKDLKRIVEDFAEPNQAELLICRRINIERDRLEKAVYRLSLLGIIDDWIIRNWDSTTGIIEVYFSDYNDNRIMNSLIEYIRKYDKSFDLKQDSEQNSKYRSILGEDLKVYEKAAKILLHWQYENIAYSRRQSIKNLADLCEKSFDSDGKFNSDKFQKTIEDYFKFTDVTYNLDFIAENPQDYNVWFSLFLRKNNKDLLTDTELNSLQINLSRFLESYRYNVGLNFISGIIRLILKKYDDQDAKARLKSAFEQINNLAKEDRMLIFNQTLEIGKSYLEQEGKERLSKLLIDNYDGVAQELYLKFEDNYSLNYLLEEASNKLAKIKRRLL